MKRGTYMTDEKRALFIIFGGTGDLARRKLYPSLYRLFRKGYLKDHFAVIGTARREWTDEYYQEIVRESIKDIQLSEESASSFSSHFRYQSHNVKDIEHYKTLKKLSDTLDEEYQLEGNRMFYLAMSPNFFGLIAENVKSQNLLTENGFNRVVIEKPFGEDYESAAQLNKEIRCSFEENQIYRIDHYLGKEMVQSILPVRFSNLLISSIWNKEFIDNVQITLSESLGVEERGGFYDHTGALKDMVQNHILQLVALIAMERPENMNADAIRKQKTTVLYALKKLSGKEVNEAFVRGQYDENLTGDKQAYRNEDQVSPDSSIETFVAGKLTIQTDRWAGVPFYIRTGKRMISKTARVDIVFKEDETPLFPNEEIFPNVLTLHLDPEQGWSFTWNNKKTGPGLSLHSEQLIHYLSEDEKEEAPEAYEKLILDSLNGDATNFAHWDEVAASWKFVDPIRQMWDKEKIHFPTYKSNTMGPKESFDLPMKDGKRWIWNPE